MSGDRPLVIDAGQVKQSGAEQELDTNAEKRLDRLEAGFRDLASMLLEAGFELPEGALHMLGD